MRINNIYLPEVVGKGYGDFWNFKGRYRVCKGSRASKKSKTSALSFIVGMMKYPTANLLVIRKTFRTLKDSCFAELKWAINRLMVQDYWICTESPLQMTYRPTGQKIYFRGLDDALKLTSITVEKGSLCWVLCEEAYEINRVEDFDLIDESVRGDVADGLYKQITLTFNPWNERHWLKRKFFDRIDSDILAKTTDYRCNEFLDEADLKAFEEMKANNPRRYNVAGLGNWGSSEGLIYENYEERDFDVVEVSERPQVKSAFGLDFGYVNDPTALFCGLVDLESKELYVFDEIYEKAMTNEMIYEAIKEKGYAKERIVADSAEPKSIDQLKRLGLPNIKAARKGRDSVNNGIQFVQSFKVIVHPKCVNFITEISNYTWDVDRFGTKVNVPIGYFNHLLDACRYAMEQFMNLPVLLPPSLAEASHLSLWRF